MTKGQETAQRLLAIIVIMAMLSVMGIPLTVIFFFATVVYFVWRAVQRSEQQDIKNIFDFYVDADEILRDGEKRWYGFEVHTIIAEGERVLHLMPDPPPLVHFALGALYNRAGEHQEAAEHLAYVVEDDQGNESRRFAPSPELRRYVQVLRRIEREPAEAPQTMAAMRSLDRQRRTRAEAMLAESRHAVGAQALKAKTPPPSITAAPAAHDRREATGGKVNALAANSVRPAPTPQPPQQQNPPKPPPIADVLRDLYEEEKKTA